MIVQNSNSPTVPVASSKPISGSAPVRAPVAATPVAKAPLQQQAEQTQTEIPRQQLGAAIETANETLRRSGSSLQFTIDNETDSAIVTMVDAESGEVIRQIPSEEALAIARSIDEMLQRFASSSGSGILYKQTA